jgi:hypothetical protein
MKLTRRELAPAAVAALAGARARGEQGPKAASRDAVKRADEIRKFKVPVETEPAFAFRAQ